ncbi:hypothetical protein D6779_06310 [Candidatus Parcubacteria bacterium]|nr:MAG: hypothetical protein D6779_06310 [Candidatus Parcubacteria bacterium]
MAAINRFSRLAVVAFSLLAASCGGNYKSVYSYTGQQFVTTNEQGQKLFFVIAPVGKWEVWDYTNKEYSTRDLQFMYMGPNQGMINSELHLKFVKIAEINSEKDKKKWSSWLDSLTEKGLEEYIRVELMRSDPKSPNNRFFGAENLIGEVRHIAGVRCDYFSYLKHIGPKLSSEKFGGMGAGELFEYYECPVLRDGDIWEFRIDINYSLSDVAIQRGMNIQFDKMVQDFKRMLKPSLESLKLFGDVKQK